MGLNGPNKERLREIHLMASQKQNQEALDALAALPPFFRLSDPEEDYLGCLEVELNTRLATQTKNRFSLLPAHSSRAGLGHWINYDSAWDFTDRSLHAKNLECRLGSTVFLPRNGIFEAAFSTTNTHPEEHSHFGLALDSRLGTNGEEQGPTFFLSREDSRWGTFWCSRFGKDSRKHKVLTNTKYLSDVTTNSFRVSIRSNDDHVSATVNGELVFEDSDVSNAFHDKFPKGRLPFLFGANIIVTRLDFTPL